MPLARVALYQRGITIYISPNTNDNPEWQATIQHIAIEGKCYFINADMIIRKDSYPDDLNAFEIEALPYWCAAEEAASSIHSGTMHGRMC